MTKDHCHTTLLNVFVTETCDDNGSTSAAESYRMLIEEWEALGEIGITFADGYNF